MMKKHALLMRLAFGACLLSLSAACTTTYDVYGRPQQSVDPVVAAAGIVAAGALGYALANNNDNYGYRGDNRYHRNYYGGGQCYPRRAYRSNYCYY